MNRNFLAGVRVLVLEDDALIAMMQTASLEDAGCTVLGPARRVDQALLLMEGERIDLALLDVNLGGEKVYPVADVLAERGVPFVFLTGYGSGLLPAAHMGRPCLTKPCGEADLLVALCGELAAKRGTVRVGP